MLTRLLNRYTITLTHSKINSDTPRSLFFCFKSANTKLNSRSGASWSLNRIWLDSVVVAVEPSMNCRRRPLARCWRADCSNAVAVQLYRTSLVADSLVCRAELSRSTVNTVVRWLVPFTSAVGHPLMTLNVHAVQRFNVDVDCRRYHCCFSQWIEIPPQLPTMWRPRTSSSGRSLLLRVLVSLLFVGIGSMTK